MKILFWYYSSRTNKKGLAPIMMRVTHNGKRFNMSTCIEVEDHQWDHTHQVVKGTTDLINKYNQYLSYLKSKVWELQNETIRNEVPFSFDILRSKINGNEAESYSLVEAFDYQISQLKARVGIDISPATVQKYETSKRKVEAFLLEEKKRHDIQLRDLNHQFIHELDIFMRTKKGLKNNGIVKNLQQLKRVIKIALLNEWISKDPFMKFRIRLQEPKRVFLTKEELERLESAPMQSDSLQKVRDLFVFSCYTGLAYADAAKLDSAHLQTINNQQWIILDRTKTKNQSTIPLLPQAAVILEKYKDRNDGRLLPVISSQNTNKYLKLIAAHAGVAKKLCFHCARHTFASTVTLNQGVDITTVSAMLGHKFLQTTQIYAKVSMVKIADDTKKLF